MQIKKKTKGWVEFGQTGDSHEVFSQQFPFWVICLDSARIIRNRPIRRAKATHIYIGVYGGPPPEAIP